MNAHAHQLTTSLALEAAAALAPGIWSGRAAEAIVRAAVQTDDVEDLEFVNVKAGRDDPHARQARLDQDRAHTRADQRSLTAFNHFLDVRKGAGLFDDYDGYSYRRGAAHRDEIQSAREVSGGWGRLVAEVSGFKVDEGIAYWFNDEYVHVPGQPWYRRCSPAAERYSFFQDRGFYDSARGEVLARFPLANDPGEPGTGVPASVFFPVDNLARYWYGEFLKHPARVKYLGPVLHALEDASIPHHAAGCMGNWHVEYENMLDAVADQCAQMPAFLAGVRARVGSWLRRPAGKRPARLTPGTRRQVPALGWAVEDTVTWLALQAYFAYVNTYRRFQRGFKPDSGSQRHLLGLAIAAGALVLIQARRSKPGK
jgi:hypothetical protein